MIQPKTKLDSFLFHQHTSESEARRIWLTIRVFGQIWIHHGLRESQKDQTGWGEDWEEPWITLCGQTVTHCLWGKFVQHTNLPKSMYVYKETELLQKMLVSKKNIILPELCSAISTKAGHYEEEQFHSNVFIATLIHHLLGSILCLVDQRTMPTNFEMALPLVKS